jgi:hypothetical protein
MERERVIGFTKDWRLFSSDGRWVTQIWKPGQWHCPPAAAHMHRIEGEFVIYLTPQWRLLSRVGRWESQLLAWDGLWHSQDAGGSPPAGEQAGTNREALARGTALAPLQAEPTRLDVAAQTAFQWRTGWCCRVEDDSGDRVQGDQGRELENGIVSHCLVCSDTPSRSAAHGLCPTCEGIFRDLGKWAASLVPYGLLSSCQSSARSCASDTFDGGPSDDVVCLCTVCLTDLPYQVRTPSTWMHQLCPICKQSLLHAVRWARFGYDLWL